MKRYHFLEGLATYWENVKILESSKVKKIEKPYTPFSYRRDAYDAFDRLFAKYRRSIIVLSYSDNGFPNRSVLPGGHPNSPTCGHPKLPHLLGHSGALA